MSLPGAWSVERDAAAFPAAVAALPAPPKALWVRGRLPSPGERAVAVVGSRAATAAGCARATDVAAVLARAGVAVVSGGAVGIDAAAHRGALAAGGATFAVLGCGIDVTYPERNRRLFDDIAVRGGVLTQFAPGTPPRGWQFPARNRIVAALSEAVLVVEAGRSSGALITARMARELGLRVLAVPGSAGADDLIRSGSAGAVPDAGSVVSALTAELAPPPQAPDRYATLLDKLQTVGSTADAGTVARAMGLGLRDALALLCEAEIDGWIRRLPGGSWQATTQAEAPRGN